MTGQSGSFMIGRRSFMAGVAGAVGSTMLMPGTKAFAQAKGQIVVGTWGGDYARLLRQNIEEPFLVKDGWEVVQDQAGDTERRAKMIAERRLPRGTADVQALQDTSLYQVFTQGLTEAIDFEKIPNAVHILPALKNEYSVIGIYSGKVVLFNPDQVQTKPTSYKDILDPALGNRTGFIDIQYRHIMAIAGLVAGGSVTAIEEGKKLLLEMRKAGARIYPTNEAFAQGLQSGEIIAGMMWKARVLQWQEAGIKIESVTPSEGFVPYTSGFAIPKNAKNPDGAYAYINAALEPMAQQKFAETMGYDATVENADLSAEMKTRVGFSAEELANMKPLDFQYFVENDNAMKSWWDQEFKA